MKNENESVYNLKQRVLSGVVALGLAIGGYVLSTPSKAYAAGHKFGTVVEQTTGTELNSYVVEDNDRTASNVSTKIVNYFLRQKEVPQEFREILKENPDASCRFWPVVVYMYEQTKGKSYHTRPGETIYFPKTFDEMVELNAELKRSGWFAKYCQKHNIYPKKKTVYIDKETAREMVFDALSYSNPDEYVCVDDDMLAAYLKTIGGKQTKYVFKDGAELTKYQTWEFYEWIPTTEEVEQYGHGKGTSKLVEVKGPSSEDLTPEETHKILKRTNKSIVA